MTFRRWPRCWLMRGMREGKDLAFWSFSGHVRNESERDSMVDVVRANEVYGGVMKQLAVVTVSVLFVSVMGMF